MLDGDSFDVSIDNRAGGSWVRLAGELDIATAPKLADKVGPLIEGRPDAIVLDLSDLAFMDSRGLRTMLQLKVRADATGTAWKVINPGRTVRLFELTGLVDELNVETD